MTSVYFREYYGRHYITIKGHSGYKPSGEDLVCAGASTLSYTLLNTLLDEEASENLKLIRKIIRDGYMHFEIELFDFSKQRICGILDACLTGFQMLEESYPDYVRVT